MFLVRQPDKYSRTVHWVDDIRTPTAWEWSPKKYVTAKHGFSGIGFTEGEAKKLIEQLRRKRGA